MKLTKEFYLQPTIQIARNLLGKFLIHRAGNGIYAAPIVETEAYCGFNDKASHASKGKTPRTEVMFRKGGCAYVYLIYGMYHCFNIVTGKEDYPAAVLIRGLDYPRADGPGKLCREFNISKEEHNGIDLTGNVLWIEDRGVHPKKIISGPRIGISYAGNCAKWPRRFFVKH